MPAATGGVVAGYVHAATCDPVRNGSGLTSASISCGGTWPIALCKRGVVRQVYSQEDDLLFCGAVLAFCSLASFPFQAAAGRNARPYLRTFATRKEAIS